MDDLTYEYYSSKNQLKRVTDAVSAGNYTEDIDSQSETENYVYDAIGNLVEDKSEGLEISWNVYGKISQIEKSAGTIVYRYDAVGNRVAKSYDGKTTIYVRDASGNVMSVYEKADEEAISLAEVHLYGSARLGMVTQRSATDSINIALSGGFGTAKELTFTRTEKIFELSNHLGNVLVTVSDRRLSVDDGEEAVAYYEADVVAANDYYPFGMGMVGRKWTSPAGAGEGGYRYGFNGMEKDNELKGEGLSYITEYRAYDPRVGRWFSVDPKTQMQPWESPYAAMNNSPLWRNDPKGDIAPIIIWALKKLGDAAIGVMTDVAVQLAAEKYFGNNGNGYATWGAAWNSLDVEWWQAIQSGGENLIKNKHLSAALSAGGDMLNYYINTDDATWDGAFARGGLGAVSAYLGGGISKFVAKYGARSVAKGLRKMGTFGNDVIHQLTGIKFNNFSFGSSFESRHIASRISAKSSWIKEKTTVALKDVNYKQDLADINDGLATEISDKTYGSIFQLKNGNRYYNDAGNLKPLAGGGYVDLNRGAAKALGLMNDEGLDSKQLKMALGKQFSREEYNQALDVYNKSR